MSSKKGQLFSMDASLSMIVFILILIFLIVVWNLYSNRFEQRVQEEEMQLAAMQSLDILTKTWGVPNDWEIKTPGNPLVLGLQLNPGSLDNKKVEVLNDDTKIDDAKFATLLNIERYEYYFRILNSQGEPVLEKGVQNTLKAKPKIVSVSSFMYHQGENREVVLTLRQ
jgi:hypothetical protein